MTHGRTHPAHIDGQGIAGGRNKTQALVALTILRGLKVPETHPLQPHHRFRRRVRTHRVPIQLHPPTGARRHLHHPVDDTDRFGHDHVTFVCRPERVVGHLKVRRVRHTATRVQGNHHLEAVVPHVPKAWRAIRLADRHFPPLKEATAPLVVPTPVC